MRELYQLKITILDIERPIWRRLLVPSGITFNKLHKIIQSAFGWQDYHLFEFEFPDVLITIPMDERYELDKPQLNAKSTRIDTFIDRHNEFLYIYDLGDYWRHHIEVEQLHSSLDLLSPQCVAGERNRPPEDVGGTMGYEEFVRIINDPNHPEYDEMLQWAEKDTGGRKFDPEYFYLNEINRKLNKIKC
jgi:hypothetical protein